jgi:phosphoribosylglycinamide formyltransferase-1
VKEKTKILVLMSSCLNNEKNLAVFASGSGSNFEAIAQACVDGRVPAKIVLLVCDNANAYAIERAKKFDIPTLVLHPRDCGGKAAYEQRIVDRLNELNVDLVCLAGYMRIVGETLYNAYEGKILNIHPALLPSFKGAHGIDDAFNFGVKVFGVTVHFIDLTIDGGVIVMQRAFEYYGNDRDEVEARIHAIEHELYPEAINKCIMQI